MANVIAKLGKPSLILAPNKTPAAQLYSEMRDFFPSNAVEYFVSYYDYYQPEAYVPQRDLFTEKDLHQRTHRANETFCDEITTDQKRYYYSGFRFLYLRNRDPKIIIL